MYSERGGLNDAMVVAGGLGDGCVGWWWKLGEDKAGADETKRRRDLEWEYKR